MTGGHRGAGRVSSPAPRGSARPAPAARRPSRATRSAAPARSPGRARRSRRPPGTRCRATGRRRAPRRRRRRVAVVQRRGQVRAAVGQHADPVRPDTVGRGAATNTGTSPAAPPHRLAHGELRQRAERLPVGGPDVRDVLGVVGAQRLPVAQVAAEQGADPGDHAAGHRRQPARCPRAPAGRAPRRRGRRPFRWWPRAPARRAAGPRGPRRSRPTRWPPWAASPPGPRR